MQVSNDNGINTVTNDTFMDDMSALYISLSHNETITSRLHSGCVDLHSLHALDFSSFQGSTQ